MSTDRARRIPGVSVHSLDAEIGAGMNDAWFGLAHVVVKRDMDHEKACVAAEFICTRLAMSIGVPVPMGDAATLDDHLAWVSAQVTLDEVTLPPADASVVLASAPRDLGAIFVFDVWVHNDDRHEENLLHHPAVGLWAIDHEQALGGETIMDPERLKAQSHQPIRWRFCDPLHLDSDAVQHWMGIVQNARSGMVDSVLHEARARGLLTKTQTEGVAEFLSVRSATIADLVRKSMGGEVPWQTEQLVFGTSSSSPQTSGGASLAT